MIWIALATPTPIADPDPEIVDPLMNVVSNSVRLAYGVTIKPFELAKQAVNVTGRGVQNAGLAISVLGQHLQTGGEVIRNLTLADVASAPANAANGIAHSTANTISSFFKSLIPW